MGRLESALQELHEGGKPLKITWFWDDGVDVKAGDEIRNFRSVSEIQPWLQHWYSLTPKAERGISLGVLLTILLFSSRRFPTSVAVVKG